MDEQKVRIEEDKDEFYKKKLFNLMEEWRCKEFEMYVAVKWVQSLSAMNVEEMFGPFRSYTDAEIYCKDKRFKLYSIYMLSKI